MLQDSDDIGLTKTCYREFPRYSDNQGMIYWAMRVSLSLPSSRPPDIVSFVARALEIKPAEDV